MLAKADLRKAKSDGAAANFFRRGCAIGGKRGMDMIVEWNHAGFNGPSPHKKGVGDHGKYLFSNSFQAGGGVIFQVSLVCFSCITRPNAWMAR